ncbi:uncharacterized protein [Periplaneta americana]|uniref:uncharacterized protein isoform X2 n=1 Tax=Periplaneta americana TaxID=6978 RepID=UPI0037E8A35D
MVHDWKKGMILHRLHQKRIQALTTTVIIILILLINLHFIKEPPRKKFLPYDPQLFAKIEGSSFEGFNNETGSVNGDYIVPNYVHFIFFGKSFIDYVTAVCVLAAFKNQRPEKIFFHTNVDKFTGPHWIKIRDTLGSVLDIRRIEMPTEIFGQKLREEWVQWHAGDVTRIRVLMEYGGIFLDNDSYIVRSLDVFRKYEMTIGITDRDYMGTQVLVAHKDARLLKLWLETYRDYHPEDWYMNAGEKPMREVLQYKPELAHTVKTLLGVHGLTDKLYVWDSWSAWRSYYSIHLVIRLRRYDVYWWQYLMWPILDETNICSYNKPFGEMAREVYSDFCR